MQRNNFYSLLIIFALFFVTLFAKTVNGKPDGGTCLQKSYELYKYNFMSKDGRIIDYDKRDITTSEGQSYIMLRSLLMDDRSTFDLTYRWTKYNLQRQDKLFAWLWGKNAQGKYGILDMNSASDADVDIAFALLLAYQKWGQYSYLQEALSVINSIWNNETKKICGQIVLMPGVNQTYEEKVEVNPSYFSPYAFRMFQKYDELHDWDYLVDSSYYYLQAVSKCTKTGLPPNWFKIENEKIVLDDSEKSDFSYDAVRVYARVYLDYSQSGEKRAKEILNQTDFFAKTWQNSGTFFVNYKANGALRDTKEFEGAMMILIPAISVIDRKAAREMYQQKVKPMISKSDYWSGKDDYYGKNLSWFGYYFYNKGFTCHIEGENKN